jgi:O-antigen ligase
MYLLLGFALAFMSLIRVDVREATSTSLGLQARFELALQLLAVSCIVLASIVGRISVRLTPALLLWITFGAFAVLSALWAPQPQLAAFKGLQLIALVTITAITAMQFGSRQAAARLLAWLTTVTLSGAIVLQVLMGGVGSLLQSYEMGRTRLTVLSIHPLILGGVAGAAAILLLAQHPRGFDWAAVTFLTAVTVLTAARAPMAVLAVLAIAWIVVRFSTPKYRFAFGIAGVAGAVLLPGILTLLVRSGWSISSLLDGMNTRNFRTLNGRIPLWQETLNRVDVASGSGLNLLNGLGYASFRYVGLEVYSFAGDAHNALLQVYVELGVIGVLLWSLAVLACVRSAWSSAPSLRGRLLDVLPVLYILAIQTMEASLADSRSFLLIFLVFYAHTGQLGPVAKPEPIAHDVERSSLRMMNAERPSTTRGTTAAAPR